MSELPPCPFDRAWIGKCGKPATSTAFCEQHSESRCKSCGSQATHDCDYTGQFVCGAPLCDDCEGWNDNTTTGAPGAWGFIGHKHRKKETAIDAIRGNDETD